MILAIFTIVTSIILALIQVYIINTKSVKQHYYIPIIVFIISTVSYICMLIQGDHFIMIGEGGLAKVIQIIIEFLTINSVTLLLYFITKKPKYKYHFFCFFIVVTVFIVLFSINKPTVKDDVHTSNLFVAETIDDNMSILNAIDTCYFESENFAGYNSYPLTLRPNLRIIHDVLNLSHMGYYTLSDDDVKTIAIALNDVEATTFHDEYLYYKSMILLGVDSDFGLERFLKNHYNEDSGLFFEDNQDENLMDQLTSTLHCIELYNIANIPIPHEDKLKSILIRLLNNDDLYINPKNIEDCYEMILTESGTILRILGLLNKSEDLLNEVSQRKEWFESIISIVFNSEHSCSQLEIWVKSDILEINNNLYELNLENNGIPHHNCLAQFTNSNINFKTEDFFHDSQYIYDFTRLNYLSDNCPVYTDFLVSFIKRSIDTYFRQQYRSTVLAQDTFYGISIANQFNVNLNHDKAISSALVWVDEFITNSDSNIESNSQALYAVKILKLLNHNLGSEDYEKLESSILNKLDSNKFITIDYQERYLLLHELTLLYMLKTEINPQNNSNMNNDLPEWITDIMAEDLATDNLNIAYDLVQLIDINDTLNTEFLNKLEEELDKKTNYILEVMDSNQSNELLDEIVRIYKIMDIAGFAEVDIKEVFRLTDLSSIYINDLSVAYNIMNLKHIE